MSFFNKHKGESRPKGESTLKKRSSRTEITGEMSPDEIAEIMSEKIILDVVRKQFEKKSGRKDA